MGGGVKKQMTKTTSASSATTTLTQQQQQQDHITQRKKSFRNSTIEAGRKDGHQETKREFVHSTIGFRKTTTTKRSLSRLSSKNLAK